MRDSTQIPSVILCRCLIIAIGASCLASCHQANKLLKAKPVPLSPFMEQRHTMSPQRQRYPAHYVWRNYYRDEQKRAAEKSEIYIAPVTLRYLRPVKQKLARWEIEHGSIRRDEQKVAAELRSAFVSAFTQSPTPRYKVARGPNSRSMTLELALVELNPTSPKGNAAKTVAKFIIGPLAGLGGIFTKGNIAIEGKVRNSATNELIFQFADNEKDKMTWYSARDFKPYGHARVAIDEWARQFEEFCRTLPEHQVKESNFFTLKPW